MKRKFTPQMQGKIGFGVIAVLLIVGIFSLVLVFGLNQLSPYSGDIATGYRCCDSGDGDLCKPNSAVNLKLKIKGVEADYQLLKTGILLEEGVNHLVPLLKPGEVLSPLPNGQYVYVNTISENELLQHIYVKEGGKCSIHGARKDPMDTVFATNLPQGCEALPDDEIVYLCTKGCEADPLNNDYGIYNAYFRVADIKNPGIPQSVKNCVKPSAAVLTQSAQKIINLPSPSSRADLQLETFYVKSDAIIGNWVSPYCKPAVYLYPEEETDVHVRIAPLGRILLTIPEYPNGGWRVKAYPNGDIYQDSTRYDYLFYEASIPDEEIILPQEGFVVAYESLSGFIPDLVTKLGLNEKEENQFSEYWLNVLPKSPFYQIKIIEQKILEKISPLYLIPSPKTSIRVTLHFTPLEKSKMLTPPVIKSPERNGFTLVEWGGIFKRDNKHSFSCLM